MSLYDQKIMKNCLVYFYQNFTFCSDLKDDESFSIYRKNMFENWMKYALSNKLGYYYRPLPLYVRFANTYHDIELIKESYDSYKTKYYKQIIVFLSPLDVNPSIKKALKIICSLDEIGYELYFLSINPKFPWSSYYINYLKYYGIFDLTFFKEKKFRSEKYNPELLQFAADLRLCNPPIKYKTIEKLLGIPKTTIITYMKRNHLNIGDNITGVDKLNPEDLERYKKLASSGSLTPNVL